ncbi:hypothetical protein F8S13_02580 [Chloroflexia bacterium SDU3-3]|nr:hypothetical protein F8S13_02580 [Chloroflexia bacterium SDU3-3]
MTYNAHRSQSAAGYRLVRPLLISAATWGELSQKLDIEQAVVDLGLSLSAEGGIDIAHGDLVLQLPINRR